MEYQMKALRFASVAPAEQEMPGAAWDKGKARDLPSLQAFLCFLFVLFFRTVLILPILALRIAIKFITQEKFGSLKEFFEMLMFIAL